MRSWRAARRPPRRTPTALEKLGPDYDFGGSSAILQTVGGKDILLAAGKGGVAIALDPGNEGKLLWRTQLWEALRKRRRPPGSGGLGRRGRWIPCLLSPLQQPNGGLKALDIKPARWKWNAAVDADRRGQAGPASAIPGAVFTGGWDGILRAVSADGKVIWSFNAVRDFSTVNGVAAKGGSFGSAGPVVEAGGMVFAASGYPGTLRGTPGNVVLAFGVEKRPFQQCGGFGSKGAVGQYRNGENVEWRQAASLTARSPSGASWDVPARADLFHQGNPRHVRRDQSQRPGRLALAGWSWR